MATKTKTRSRPKAKTPRKAARRTAARKPKRVEAAEAPQADETPQEKALGAGDVIGKLLESPLMVDLIAVGATAALAAITEHRFSHRSADTTGSKRAAKAAAKAAAAAMGRRIAVEVEEVLKASKKPKPGGAR